MDFSKFRTRKVNFLAVGKMLQGVNEPLFKLFDLTQRVFSSMSAHWYSIYSLLLEDENDFNIGPVYHGGTWDGVKAIKTTGRGALGSGAYFTPIKDVAQGYAAESGGQLIQTRLRVHNPLKIYTDNNRTHPMVDALVQLGVDQAKAEAFVEKEEMKKGYLGTQVKNLAQSKGYDAIFQFFNGKLREIVVWNANQVEYQKKK